MKKHIFLILTVFSFLFVSCSNLFESSLEEGSNSTTRINTAVSYVTVTGSMLLDGAFPEEVVSTGSTTGYSGSSAGRTAFPENPGITNYDLYITATNTTDSTDTITNTILAADNTDGTYTIGIPVADTQKSYTIEVVAKEAGDTTEILKGESESFPISTEEPVVNKNITLHAISNEGHGYIDLDIDITGTGENISRGVLLLPEIECRISVPVNFNFILDTKKINFTDDLASIEEIPSGSYKAKFIFYKDISETIEIYSFYQTVNVYSGLTTNTWVKNGSEPYLVDSDDSSTVCKITQELLTDYELTNIYVNSDLTTDPEDNSKPYTANTGTFLNPLVSFQDAIDKINNPSKDYTIHVKGSHHGYFELTDDLNTRMNSLTIVGSSPLINGLPQDKLFGYRSALGDDELIDGYEIVGLTETVNDVETVIQPPSEIFTTLSQNNLVHPVLLIKTHKPVTLENIEISNGFSGAGAGLLINVTGDTAGAVTIKDGVVIRNNLSWKGGGGVAVSNATLKMTGGKITNNCTYFSEANSSGGGVLVKSKGKFVLSGGEISYNKSSHYGGGVAIINSDDNTFIMTGGEICYNRAECVNHSGTHCGCGGGLYLEYGSVNISGGLIHNNYAESSTGGIEVYEGVLSITGGEISNNTSDGEIQGIYISARNTTFNLSGNAYIPSGENGNHGICLDHYDYNGTIADAKITLCGPLTNHSESDPIYIAPANYTRGNTVVQAEGTYISNLSSYTKKFVLSDEDANLRTPSGDRSKLVIDLPIFVKQGGCNADAENAGTRAHPVGSIEIACSSTLMNNRDIDYTIAIDGTLEDAQIIPGNISERAKSITITGANGFYPDNETVEENLRGTLKDSIGYEGLNVENPVLTYKAESGLYVDNFSLLLSDIKITGSNNKTTDATNYGGGAHIEGVKLYIEGETHITGNTSLLGGGLYLKESTLYMYGGKISSNKAESPSVSYSCY